MASGRAGSIAAKVPPRGSLVNARSDRRWVRFLLLPVIMPVPPAAPEIDTPSVRVVFLGDIDGAPPTWRLDVPADWARLVDAIRRCSDDESATASGAEGPARERRSPDIAAPPVEVVLFVSPGSPACERARECLESLLAGFSAEQVRFEVSDVSVDVERAERAHVAFTPTIVIRAKDQPPAWIFGALTDVAPLREHLGRAGLDTTGDCP